MRTLYQYWAWERYEHNNWSMVMQRQHPLLELPLPLGLCSLGALRSYFSAPTRKNLVLFVFFSAPPYYRCSAAKYPFRPPQNVFGPQFFFAALRKTVGLCSLGALKSSFSAPKRENLVFFFLLFRRRLVMVLGGQITFSIPQFFFRRLFLFSAPFFGAQNQKSAFSAGAQGVKAYLEVYWPFAGGLSAVGANFA